MDPNFDGFDLLPNSLIFKIISLVPFKEAGRTSILSKRWRHLWKNTTNIEFNEHYFVRSYRRVQRRDFLKFIKSWIKNHKENSIVEKFSLTLLLKPGHETHDCAIVETCVAFATQRGVKDLMLNFSDPDWTEEDFDEPEAMFELPTKVYEHKALESLKLASCNFVETELIKLHALKEVSFAWMELKKDAIKILLSNCKMITSLNLKKCWTSYKFECGGIDLSLKRLVVDSCNFLDNKFTINAPKLTYFKYYGNLIHFEIEKSFLLEEVDLDFGLEYEYPKANELIYKVIKDFKHAEVLNVCTYTLQVLSYELEPFPMEDEMMTRHLKIMTNLHNDECLGISFLLNSCCILEHLTVYLGFGRLFDKLPDEYSSNDGGGDNQRTWVDYENTWPCLTSTLKMVEINNFTATENEVLMLHYLIYNGSVLERLYVHVNKGEPEKVRNYRKIEEFVMTIPRASINLQILFHY